MDLVEGTQDLVVEERLFGMKMGMFRSANSKKLEECTNNGAKIQALIY